MLQLGHPAAESPHRQRRLPGSNFLSNIIIFIELNLYLKIPIKENNKPNEGIGVVLCEEASNKFKLERSRVERVTKLNFKICKANYQNFFIF